MEKIIELVLLAILGIVGMIVYLILVGTVLPNALLKVKSSVDTSTDRGIGKYVYPTGRGILYEPHPAIRQHIRSYLLFTHDGYKYIKCRVGAGVHTVGYSVAMFNAKNQLIDMIDVNQSKIYNGRTEQVMLHGDTSYVQLFLLSVNQTQYPKKDFLYYRVGRLAIYMASVAALSYVQMIVIKFGVDVLFKVIMAEANNPYTASVSAYVFPALLIGCLAGAMVCFHYAEKGIRCTK